jgi:glycosyltransferase involved in cell wall biosynthesis
MNGATPGEERREQWTGTGSGRDNQATRSVISVVVPVWNGMPWLEQQLGALADQECDGPWEVIVADNGSTDQSQHVAAAWSGRHGQIRLIDASGVRGAPAARNAGARAARGELLAFCDSDDVVRPGWLASCAKALETADVVAGIFDFWSLNGLPDSPPLPASMRQLPFLPAGLGANLAVRHDAFDAVGGFSEDLVTGEDVDLCWRLQIGGYRFAIEEGAVVSKRDRTGFCEVFRQGFAFGRGGPVLYRRHRRAGARLNLNGAARSWLWLLVHLPVLVEAGGQRNQWARAAGMRTGRLVGSVAERVLFP